MTPNLRLLVPLAFAVLPVWSQSPYPADTYRGRSVVAQEIIVQFRNPPPPDILFEVQRLSDARGSRAVGDPSRNLFVFHSRSKDVDTLLKELEAHSAVVFVQPNFIIHSTATPNDPSFSQLWGLKNSTGADIRATAAWESSTGGSLAAIGVLDSGMDYAHPDLAANVWSAPAKFTVNIGSASIACPTGSHGYNAINNTCDPKDDNGHGTHVAGTIGAVGNNGIGVTGVNWTARMVAAKMMDASGSGTSEQAVNAIEFLIQAKQAFAGTATPLDIRVLSASWGGGGSDPAIDAAVSKAAAAGMLFVAAAGNAGMNTDVSPFSPASSNLPNLIAVAATDMNDALASFSNYGPNTIHLGAPGVFVLSTDRNGTYSVKSGTSMATPHVSGAALLILSACPDFDTAALKNAILGSVDPLPALAGKTISGGRLNVGKAMMSCRPSFSLAAEAPQRAVAPGGSTAFSTAVTPAYGFSGSVALSVTGLPAGAGASFSINPTAVSTTPVYSTLTVFTAAATPPGSYTLIVTGVSGAFVRTLNLGLTVGSASPSPSSAVFVKTDTTTQGNWRLAYGSEGYAVAGDVTSYPGYVNPLIAANGPYTWVPSTSDTRALQKGSNPADRVAGTWYGSQPFTIDLNFTDTKPHQVALYCLDWDSASRRQTVEALNENGDVLNTQVLNSSFNGGVYLVWNVTGHIVFRISLTGGANAVLSGLLFGPAAGTPPPGPQSVIAVAGTPQTAQTGTAFAVALQAKVTDASANPVSGVTVTFTAPASGAGAAFAGSTTAAAMTNGSGIAVSPLPVANNAAGTYIVSASVTGLPQAAFTLTNTPPVQVVQSIVAVAGTPQTTQTGAAFAAALQARVLDTSANPVSGVTVTFTAPASGASATFAGSATATAVTNASGTAVSPFLTANSSAGAYSVLASVPGLTAAVFTLTNAALVPPAAAVFVKADTATQGNWRSAYGSEGYSIAGDWTANPPYVSPALVGSAQYTWVPSTTDIRALQKASNPAARSAGTWYGGQFTIDLSFGDTAQHQVAVYCLDWDSTARRQLVEVLDANGNVLNTQNLSSTFNGGVYLVWNVSGHVKLRTTSSAGANGVVSGLFFGTAASPGTPVPQSVGSLSGTPQTAQVGAAFASALQAKVTDGSGNPVSGTLVIFTAPSSGASAAFAGSSTAAAVTNANGIATSPLPAANNQAGTYVVSAAVTGLTPASFMLTNSAVAPAPAPASVIALAGSPQTAQVGAAFASALQAKVTDGSGNPVSGTLVIFTAPSSGASAAFAGLGAAGAMTNANGIATSPIPVANSIAGAYVVSAAVTGLTPAAFTLVNSSAPPPGGSAATFVRADTATQGNWQGGYGLDGYSVAGDLAANPAYVLPLWAGNNTYTWVDSTADIRALRKPSNPVTRIAGAWYSSPSFTLDLNFTDAAQHQVALYCLDWDSTGRRQTIDVLDANGNVLNTQALSSFNNGVYLVWNLSGHVKLRVTVTAGPNAAVSGLFFR